MHGGLVGAGMLDAACPGEVFTSPTPDQTEAATKAVDGGAGVVHIVKNYTGDVMNFEMAAEPCRAEGTEVESVVVDDDVAVQDSLYTAGRRSGHDRADGEDRRCGRGTEAALEGGRRHSPRGERQRSLDGMALTSCTVPAAGSPTFVWATTRSRWASASTASPGASA